MQMVDLTHGKNGGELCIVFYKENYLMYKIMS